MRNISNPMAGRYDDEDREVDRAYRFKRRVGREVADLRAEAGLTQADVAKVLGITDQAISGVERGTYTLPPERYEAMAELFGLDREQWGIFLLRYSNPWVYALIYGHRAEDLKSDINAIPVRVSRKRKPQLAQKRA